MQLTKYLTTKFKLKLILKNVKMSWNLLERAFKKKTKNNRRILVSIREYGINSADNQNMGSWQWEGGGEIVPNSRVLLNNLFF